MLLLILLCETEFWKWSVKYETNDKTINTSNELIIILSKNQHVLNEVDAQYATILISNHRLCLVIFNDESTKRGWKHSRIAAEIDFEEELIWFVAVL